MKTHPGNPKLKNHFPKGFEGTPFKENGQFRNVDIEFIPQIRHVFKWKFSDSPDKEAKKNDHWRPEVVHGHHFIHEKEDCIVWLGHASFYLHLGGKRILIDPVYGNVSYMPRLIPFPCRGADLKNIDLLLISHNHRDHCDEKSLKTLLKENPGIKILTGLKMENVLRRWFPNNEIQEAGWFQEFETGVHDLKITYVPSRHWSKRWLKDDNKSLWGGFVIQHAGKTIYFMGDSGYGEHFKMIKEIFPDPDYCLMGIGAFKPEWFMGPSHISPKDAVRAFNELGGKHFIPMHYATFDLSDEAISEPVKTVKDLNSKGKLHGELNVLKPGEVLFIRSHVEVT